MKECKWTERSLWRIDSDRRSRIITSVCAAQRCVRPGTWADPWWLCKGGQCFLTIVTGGEWTYAAAAADQSNTMRRHFLQVQIELKRNNKDYHHTHTHTHNVRLMLQKKESNYLRRKRPKMERSMFEKIKDPFSFPHSLPNMDKKSLKGKYNSTSDHM